MEAGAGKMGPELQRRRRRLPRRIVRIASRRRQVRSQLGEGAAWPVPLARPAQPSAEGAAAPRACRAATALGGVAHWGLSAGMCAGRRCSMWGVWTRAFREAKRSITSTDWTPASASFSSLMWRRRAPSPSLLRNVARCAESRLPQRQHPRRRRRRRFERPQAAPVPVPPWGPLGRRRRWCPCFEWPLPARPVRYPVGPSAAGPPQASSREGVADEAGERCHECEAGVGDRESLPDERARGAADDLLRRRPRRARIEAARPRADPPRASQCGRSLTRPPNALASS